MIAASWELNPKITYQSLLSEFVRNPVLAWMNYGSVILRVQGATKALRDPDIVERGSAPGRAHPWDPIHEAFSAIFRGTPGRKYFVHIDLSKNHDGTGAAMVHREPGTRTWVVDFMLQLLPALGKEIDIAGVRQRFAVDLRDKRGFDIAGVSYDGWQCVRSDTLINTGRGLLPIAEVEPGDTVQSRSGPRAVLKRFDFGPCPTLRIETSDGDVLEGTAQHRIEVLEQRTWRLGQTRRPVWAWRTLGELRVGDVVHMAGATDLVVPNAVLDPTVFYAPRLGGPLGVLSDWTPPAQVTEVFAEWLGLIWGDGSLDRDGARLTVTPDESLDAARVFSEVFGAPFEVRPDGPTHGVVSVSSRPLRRWLAANECDKPLIPRVILESSRSVKAAFLRGLFAADGSVQESHGRVTLWTSLVELARQVRIILRTEFGLESKLVTHRRAKLGTRYREGPAYAVYVRGSRARFAEQIGFTYRRKQVVLEANHKRPGRSLFTTVASIVSSSAIVHDLQVEGDPSYTANGFVSHNSAESLQTLEKQGFAATYLSVDRNKGPYDTLIGLLHERNLDFYAYAPFATQMCELELVRGTKYDHPRKFRDGTPGRKDVADAVAGALANGFAYERDHPNEVSELYIHRNPQLSKPDRYGERSLW